MRRPLVTTALALAALAAPASAQVYDRYGGSAAYAMPAYAQGPSRVLTWNGKQTQQAPQMAQPQPQAYPQPYPQQGYPQQGYPQQAYAYPQQTAYPPQQAYPQPQPQQGYGYPQQGYYPSIQGRYGQPPLGAKRQQQQEQPYSQQMPPYREGPQQGMPSYEDMQRQKLQQQAMQQSMQPPQPFPIMSTPPQGAWAYQPGYAPQQAYPQQPYPQQAYAQPVPAGYPQPQPYPAQAYPQPAQPQAMPLPADPAVTAAPTTPVQSQPLPTSIYAPGPPRAELAPPMPAGLPTDVQSQPSGGGAGATALASLDYRSLAANDARNPGVRHYSVHRPFGMSPDPAPIPPVDNQIIITQPQDADLADTTDLGLRGVGMDPPEKSKKSDD